MMLYISVRDYSRKLKFSSYVHLPSINKMLQYHYARMILFSEGEVSIFEDVSYILGLELIRMLILTVIFF